MASRSRSRTPQAAPGAPSVTTIADLPDEALVHALGFLDLRQRQRAALVSKRFAALACSPELLRRLDVRICGVYKLSSFLAFIVSHGCHMQQLSFTDHAHPGEESASAAAAVAACMAAAGAVGQLTKLEFCSDAPSTEWLASMRGLRSLMLESLHPGPPTSPAIGMLTALESIDLEGYLNILSPAARLPSSVTKLAVWTSDEESMPPQFGQLPALQQLDIGDCSYSAASMAPLSSLSGSLTWLELFASAVPDSLSALTQLRYLRVANAGPSDAQQFSSALARLQRLTCLRLRCGTDVLAGLPPGVRELGQLRLLEFECHARNKQALPPAGPWLDHLETLATHADIVLPGSAVLAAAPQLQNLRITSVPKPATAAFAACWSGPAWQAFWSWAAVHPPLTRLEFGATRRDSGAVWHPLFAAAMRLRSQRPSLAIQCCSPYCFVDDD